MTPVTRQNPFPSDLAAIFFTHKTCGFHRPKTLKMNIIFLLILVSLIIAIGFLAAFIWAVKSGQYEDDYTPSVRMLFDDKPSSKSAARPSSVDSSKSVEKVNFNTTKTEVCS